MPYAHTPNEQGRWHDLVEHLRGTAELAGAFAGPFGARDLAYYLGLWHDLGKFHPAFQRYLEDCHREPDRPRRGPDHKAAGTLLASQSMGLPAFCVQGHHGGLRSRTDLESWLGQRRADPATEEALRLAHAALSDLEPGKLPPPAWVREEPLAAELFVRMLFSTLVDADYLDTERHLRPDDASLRQTSVTPSLLWERFEADHRRRFQRTTGHVNEVRREVFASCLDAAALPPGLFRLTVPTGGGKTRSAMAFALRHAMAHGLRRVVVAVPYISITEQTAAVYHDIFGQDDIGRPLVLEHHSGTADSDDPEGTYDTRSTWRRLAAENWEAPVIVTTTVQLFESLFSNATSATRKVHRLTGSVIVLDEAQALPTHLLEPVLDALRELCEHYGTTVVLSTATQPAFDAVPAFAGLQAREIVQEPVRHFRALERVEYDWRLDPAMAWEEVAGLMRAAPQALAIVNTKRDAMALLDALDDPEALHLSTLLCGAHRRAVIKNVRQRLEDGSPCRLVSTQVVEAGVDLDFPLVLRALGPLDSIIQAAGRCNREGRRDRGRVVVFRPADPGPLPIGAYRTATDVAQGMLAHGPLDLNGPDAPREYLGRLFQSVSLDRERIQEVRASFDFPAVAERFRMVDQATESVVITDYGSHDEQERVRWLLGHLRTATGDTRGLRRQLQPYVVNLYQRRASDLRQQGFISDVVPGLGRWLGDYDPVRGIVARDRSPDELVV